MFSKIFRDLRDPKTNNNLQSLTYSLSLLIGLLIPFILQNYYMLTILIVTALTLICSSRKVKGLNTELLFSGIYILMLLLLVLLI
ncbi:hypothetical protein [Alkaliphilus sp. B6464]|uniref:hypothetical protein n=1 Tax=Alkaliphilus sp. B6464 TaxID=2731219 RepID=UPI001BADD6BB|nr:hypothetical protein [Alkaliphilus sp. B6464]QUH21788.1 hypothetical protein HYG84_17790 [Alkaliphilus sp. B6464]